MTMQFEKPVLLRARIVKYSDVIHVILGMNDICFELSLSLGVGLRHYRNKAGQTPPSTTVASRYSFLRELQGKVPEKCHSAVKIVIAQSTSAL